MLLRERQVSYDITYMQHLKKIMQKKKRNKALKALKKNYANEFTY